MMDYTTSGSSTTNCYVQPYNPFPMTFQPTLSFSYPLVAQLSDTQVVDLETRFRAIVQEELAHAFALLVEKEDSTQEEQPV